MQQPQFTIEEVTDPAAIARFRTGMEHFGRNLDWLEAHWPDLLPRANGKFLAVAGQEAFVADSAEQAWAWTKNVHPEDHGAWVHFVRPGQGPRIYANLGAVVGL